MYSIEDKHECLGTGCEDMGATVHVTIRLGIPTWLFERPENYRPTQPGYHWSQFTKSPSIKD